jgi:hypothetical protein
VTDPRYINEYWDWADAIEADVYEAPKDDIMGTEGQIDPPAKEQT